jgi:threonine/homoserine/homoserine lactone efflux protein
MAFDTWIIYALAALGLSLTPGPNGLLVLTHGALYGAKRTLATILGGSLGFALVIGLSMFGLGAFLVAAPDLIIWLKLAGGLYLIWLGVQVWRAPAMRVGKVQEATSLSPLALFRQGLLAASSNPKGILFFVAFLPQFVVPERSLLAQFAIMALTFVVIEFGYEFLVAFFADRLQPLLAKAGKRFNRFFGGVFIVIGVLLPLR